MGDDVSCGDSSTSYSPIFTLSFRLATELPMHDDGINYNVIV